jgi:predicted transcriptional regulator
MEVHFPPDVESRLQQLASANGKNPEQLVKETIIRMLETQSRFRGAVRKGVEQADRGELIEDDDVRRWLEQQERA